MEEILKTNFNWKFKEIEIKSIDAAEIYINQGSSAKLYYGIIDYITDDGFILFNDLINKEHIELNSNWIIHKKRIQLVRRVFKKDNRKFNYFYCLKPDQKYELDYDEVNTGKLGKNYIEMIIEESQN